jgi:hypothetical protein
MAILLPTRIDRSTLRMITIKRSVSGALSVVFALALLGYGLVHFGDWNAKSRLYCIVGVLVFGGGGGWSLRDAVIGWRLLSTR